MEVYDKNLSENEKRLGKLILDSSKEGLGKLVGFFVGGFDEMPIYYKLAVNTMGESERIFYTLSKEDDKEVVVPFEEKDIKYYVSAPWLTNYIFFDNSYDTYFAYYSSIVYDEMEFYVVGKGNTQEKAVEDLISSIFLIYNINSNDYKPY